MAPRNSTQLHVYSRQAWRVAYCIRVWRSLHGSARFYFACFTPISMCPLVDRQASDRNLTASMTGRLLHFGWLLIALSMLSLAQTAIAEGIADAHPQVRSFFPDADRFGMYKGDPPAAPVYHGDELLGYVFETTQVQKIPAYSGKPVNVLLGIDMEGRITGTEVLEHHEPILLVGIPEQALFDFAAEYRGKSVTDRVRVGAGKKEGYVNIDAITGATVTVMVVNQSIMGAARKVAISRGIIAEAAEAHVPPARVRMEVYQDANWKFLTGNGAIRRLRLSRADVDTAFENIEAGRAVSGVAGTCEALPPGEPCDLFIDLFYAYLNAPTIGRNLLGESQYNWLMAELKPGEHAIAVMANGPYSFKGSGYVRGGIFDRIQIIQKGDVISFRDLDYYRLSDVYADGMPEFSEMAIFIIRTHYGFDPGRAWRLELLASRATGPLSSVFTSFSADYLIPEAYVELPEPPPAAEALEQPIWVTVWRERTWQIAVLGVALTFLMLVLIFQDWLARHPTLLGRVRIGYLLFTVVFIGWYMLGQLSVVNVLTFVGAVVHDFRWDTFLIDPTMFILWSFVAVTLLLWGRGVYCGWLCPFGALQTLINTLSRKLKVPQLNFPQAVHERLWAIKYLILLLLFGISLQSIGTAERYAEVEPFKTAITLHFQREWAYVFYAVALLAISAFNSKFYCKYLCPLGAALAIPVRHSLFDWLRRRKECGKPCRICEHECEIQAINDTGDINSNECHYCLDCQVTYYNAYKCPPLAERRKRHERAATAKKSLQRIEEAMGARAELENIPVKVESADTSRKPRGKRSNS